MLSIFATNAAQARFISPLIPTFGLTTNDATIIKEGVTIDFKDFGISYEATVYADYTVMALHDNIILDVPTICNVINQPNISIKIDATNFTGELQYGNVFSDEEILSPKNIVSGLSSNDLSDTRIGYLYRFSPTSNELVVNMKRVADQPLIYDSSNSSTSASGRDYFNLTLKNVEPNRIYYFFVGNNDFPSPPITNAPYTIEVMTYKQFVDLYFNIYKEIFEQFFQVPKSYYYAMMNKMFNSCINLTSENFFFETINYKRSNSYRVKVPAIIGQFMKIHVIQKMYVQNDHSYNPTIYRAKYKPSENHDTEFALQLDPKFPYILDSNLSPNSENKFLMTKQTDNFSFSFSSVQNPVDWTLATQNDKWLLWLFFGSGIIALGIFIFLCIKLNNKKTKTDTL